MLVSDALRRHGTGEKRRTGFRPNRRDGFGAAFGQFESGSITGR